MKVNLICSACGGPVGFINHAETDNIKAMTTYYCQKCQSSEVFETIEIDYQVTLRAKIDTNKNQ